jgi:hypothetical protein
MTKKIKIIEGGVYKELLNIFGEFSDFRVALNRHLGI